MLSYNEIKSLIIIQVLARKSQLEKMESTGAELERRRREVSHQITPGAELGRRTKEVSQQIIPGDGLSEVTRSREGSKRYTMELRWQVKGLVGSGSGCQLAKSWSQIRMRIFLMRIRNTGKNPLVLNGFTVRVYVGCDGLCMVDHPLIVPPPPPGPKSHCHMNLHSPSFPSPNGIQLWQASSFNEKCRLGDREREKENK